MRTLILSMMLLAACSGGDSDDTTDGPGTTSELDCSEAHDTYVPGLSKAGSEYTFTLLSAVPDPPDRGDNTWQVEITDAGGRPVAGLDLVVEPYMPEHGHGTNPKTFAADELGDGVYEFVAIDLFMPGLWQLFFRVEDGAAADVTVTGEPSAEQVEFRFCLQG